MRLPRIAIVIMSSAVVVITSISMNAFSLFLTPIEETFDWSRTTATIPYVFAMLGWGIGGVLFGKKADDLGTRPVILGGILLMAAGFFGMGLSQNLWQLSVTFGLMTGMAKGACGLVIISLLVAKHYDAESRGLAVSIVQTASPLSPFFPGAAAVLSHQELRLARGRHGVRGAAPGGGVPVRVDRRARSGPHFRPPA